MADKVAQEYWQSRYVNGGNSGYGSYDQQLHRKLNWLQGLNISSVSEIGCGDFNFGKHLMQMYPHATYTGTDLSMHIIAKNQIEYPRYSFGMGNIPKADLILCIDVLFHILDDQEYERVLEELDSKWTRYLAITAYENEQETSPHLKIRKFDPSRFGEPVVREVVEEDGQLYFYLFEKPNINLRKVSACLVTKEHKYPRQILEHLDKFKFDEIIIITDSDSPHRKYEAFKRARNELIYYQDDDAICPIGELAKLSDPSKINLAMTPNHFEAYKDKRITMGLGWGAIFPKSILSSLKKYTDVYGEDEIFKRETERILTYLNYPQNRFVLPIEQLPSAYAQDRLWREPQHYSNIDIVEERCAKL